MENSRTLQKETGILAWYCKTVRKNYVAFELGNFVLLALILMVGPLWLSNHYTPERLLMGEFAVSMISLAVLCFSVIPCYIAETASQEDETDKESPFETEEEGDEDEEEDDCSSTEKKSHFSFVYAVSCGCFTPMSIFFFFDQFGNLIKDGAFETTHLVLWIIEVIWLALCIYGCVKVSKKMLPEF